MSAEEQRNAPNAGKSDKGINDSADKCALAAKQPCDKVKLKNTDQTPVQRTDDAEYQCQSIRKNPSYFSGELSMDEFLGSIRKKIGEICQKRGIYKWQILRYNRITKLCDRTHRNYMERLMNL